MSHATPAPRTPIDTTAQEMASAIARCVDDATEASPEGMPLWHALRGASAVLLVLAQETTDPDDATEACDDCGGPLPDSFRPGYVPFLQTLRQITDEFLGPAGASLSRNSRLPREFFIGGRAALNLMQDLMDRPQMPDRACTALVAAVRADLVADQAETA